MPNELPDWEVASILNSLANAYGGATSYIPNNAAWTTEMILIGRDMVRGLGLDTDKAEALKPRELHDFYVTAKKSIEGARRLARKMNGRGNATPTPQAPQGLTETALQDLMARIATGATEETRALVEQSLASIPAMVKAELELNAPKRIEVVNATTGATVSIANPHYSFDEVLAYSAKRKNTFLVGPAGSGKTTIAEHVAVALSLPFYGESKVEFASTLAGYKDALSGTYVRSNFREAYEFGGVFLLDEGDSSNASALLFINAAISGKWALFPDGKVMRHPDFVCIVAANTYGRGATRKFIGRTKLDGAFMDRFAVLTIGYDEALETNLAVNKDWCKYVQSVRQIVLDDELEMIVSPRATFEGGDMLDVMPWDKVADAYIWKGIDGETRRMIETQAPMSRYETSIL